MTPGVAVEGEAGNGCVFLGKEIGEKRRLKISTCLARVGDLI